MTETETFSSVCVILVLAFPSVSANNFSSHSFRQKPKEPEWDWRSRAASWRRTAERSRQRIVTVAAPVLRFACLKQRRTNQGRRLSYWREKVTSARSAFVSPRCRSQNLRHPRDPRRANERL